MTNTTSASKCPSCGQPASGKFCIHCGTPLGSGKCPNCQANLPPGVRFCTSCGASVGATGAVASSSSRLPWVIAAGAVVVAVLVVAVRFTAPPPSAQQAAPAAAPAPGMAPDISGMGPREQADRLFNRIMAAAEQGDSSSMLFHTDMAIQAYQMLGELDNDARFHLGLIHLIRGEAAPALEQADAMEASVPNHLLALMLRHMASTRLGDSAAMRDAASRFLANYEEEIASERPEYEMHRGQIDAFRAEARAATGGGGS